MKETQEKRNERTEITERMNSWFGDVTVWYNSDGTESQPFANLAYYVNYDNDKKDK